MCKYIDRNIQISTFLVDCEWDVFGDWTSCSKSCGGGENSRTRTVKTTEQNGGNPCLGETTETQSCNVDSCPGMYNSLIYR
jgi:hypothetical protein